MMADTSSRPFDNQNDGWLVIRVMAPEIIWARYADALGLEKLRQTFGQHWPPPAARAGEEVFTFRDPQQFAPVFNPKDHPAAWISLARDQFNPKHAHMSRGVWPDYHGRGLGRALRSFGERWARHHGCISLNIEVAAVNHPHIKNVSQDPYWQPRGVLYTPLTHLFTHSL
jgi:GNAT superfamily N-acetyltransferase